MSIQKNCSIRSTPWFYVLNLNVTYIQSPEGGAWTVLVFLEQHSVPRQSCIEGKNWLLLWLYHATTVVTMKLNCVKCNPWGHWRHTPTNTVWGVGWKSVCFIKNWCGWARACTLLCSPSKVGSTNQTTELQS
jgi:hypothetical protein